MACYNPNTGLLLWSNEYNTNTVNGNGEHFADIVVDENNNLYIVGGTDYIPDDVNSMVLSVDGLTGNILWQWQTNIGSSDVFRAISYHDNDLYIAGYFRRGHNNSDYYDISLTSVNRTFGTINWRSSVNINHPNINNDCSKPHDIHISSGGNILIHGTVFNDWSGTNGNHTWLLSGFIDKSSSPDVTLTNLYFYDNTTTTHQNYSRIFPLNSDYTNFLLLQNPGSSFFNHSYDISGQTARVSQIQNFTNVDWSRRFIKNGNQGLFAITKGLESDTNYQFWGASINATGQINAGFKDAHVINSTLPIPLNGDDTTECSIVKDSLEIISLDVNLTNQNWVFNNLVMNITPLSDESINLVVEIPCGLYNCIIDTNITTILNNATISTSTYLSGKYYIQGTLTIDNNAVVDMTNVDMIFESCASIEIKDGARIRANNSLKRVN